MIELFLALVCMFILAAIFKLFGPIWGTVTLVLVTSPVWLIALFLIAL